MTDANGVIDPKSVVNSRMPDATDATKTATNETDVTITVALSENEQLLISDKYEAWKAECNARFARLKANEEELIRIFWGGA